MTTDQLRELFKLFAAKSPVRYKINDPWVAAGHIAATDGIVVVRCKVDDPDDSDISNVPKMESLPWDQSLYGQWFDIPNLDEFEEKVECEACGGDGEHDCPECDMPHDCGECGGTGEVEYEGKPVEVGPVLIADIYLARLIKVGATKIQIAVKELHKHPVRFGFGDGCEGLLNVIRKE